MACFFCGRNACFLKESYIPSLALTAYDVEESKMRTLMQGALKLNGIEFIEYIDEGKVEVAVGNPDVSKDDIWEIPLAYTPKNSRS